MRVSKAEFLDLDLEVHAILRDVPLKDVSAVDLPGGGEGRSIEDVRALMAGGSAPRAGPAARALFALRRWLGRLFGWDRDAPGVGATVSEFRLTSGQKARSRVPPGTREGLFRLLFASDREMLGEIRNATVHAFSCMAILPRPGGYRFYWAVYVEPVSRFTPIYMAVIEPFRRFVVYPSILTRLRREWIAAGGERRSERVGRGNGGD